MGKAPLILIPGMLCDHHLWQHQVSALRPVAACTITDAHMHQDTIGHIATAIVASAPPHFALAGLSLGGYVALEIVRKFSQRVDRLALIDTSAGLDTAEQVDRRKRLMAQCRQGRFTDVVEQLYSLFVHSERLTDRALKHQIVEMAYRVGPDVFIRQQNAILNRVNQMPHLEKITCPTIIICGAQDQITPLQRSEEMTANITGARLEAIKRCGHMSSMERPGEVSKILYHWLTAV